MDYQRNWLEERGSEDSQGRSLWALGTMLNRSHAVPLHHMAGRLFEQSLLSILDTASPRAWAFALLGLYEYLQRFEGDRRAHLVQEELAHRLLALYRLNSSETWCWFEPFLTYCNATIAHAMLLTSNLWRPRQRSRLVSRPIMLRVTRRGASMRATPSSGFWGATT
jgi:hypothetical protein